MPRTSPDLSGSEVKGIVREAGPRAAVGDLQPGARVPGLAQTLEQIEQHARRIARAMDHGMEEEAAVRSLIELRRELSAFQNRLVKARLEYLRQAADTRYRAHAAEVLNLLESRWEASHDATEMEE